MGIFNRIFFYLQGNNSVGKGSYNIINQKEINAFITRLQLQRPQDFRYIEKKVSKYLKTEAFVVESRLYPVVLYLKCLLKIADRKEVSIFKKHGLFGKYHFVCCGEGLLSRVISILEFSEKMDNSSEKSFKELMYDFQERQISISKTSSLTPGLDYDVVIVHHKYEVWKLLSVSAFKQEGFVMKNCLGKAIFPNKKYYILSVKDSKNTKVLTLKIDSKTNILLEAKQKVNKPVCQYQHILLDVTKQLKIIIKPNRDG